MKASTAAGVVIGAGVLGLVAWLAWRASKATAGIGQSVSEATAAALQAVNPASDQNLAYRAANAVTQAVTGDAETTVGVKLWEWFNPAQAARDASIAGTTGGSASAAAADAAGLSDYWSRLMSPTYLDDMARAEKLNAMKNLRQVPPGTRSTDIWLVG